MGYVVEEAALIDLLHPIATQEDSRMKLHRLPFAIVALTLVLLGAARAEQTLRFATLTSINKAPPGIVAEQKGLFKKEGINVEMKLFVSGQAAVQALAAGQYDVAMLGDIPALALLAQGYKGKIIAGGLGGPKRQAVVVPTASGAKTLHDLKGKKIGLTLGSTDEIALKAAIDKEGLKWSDFTFVNLQPPAKLVALQTGQVDAVEAWEPVPSIIVVKGVGRRLLTADGYLPDMVGITLASEGILKSNPELVVRFLRALNQGSAYAQANPEEMRQLLSEQLKLEGDVLSESIPTQWWYIEPHADTVSDWQHSANFMHAAGRIKEPMKVQTFVDFSYFSRATGVSYPLVSSSNQVMKYLTLNRTTR